MLRTVLFLVGTALCAVAQSQVWLAETVIDTAVVAENLEIPWDMQRWNEDTIIFTERSGSIKRLAVNSGVVEVVYTADDVAVEGQGGLMGIQLHPAFPSTPYAYVAQNYADGWIIKLRVDRLIFNAVIDEFSFDSTIVSEIPSSITNIGGRMLIDDQGRLLLTVGDVKNNDFPQDESSLNGKVLRYHLDGTIPAENPISNSPVFSLGHRNPQGLAQSPDGIIYSSEHGPSSNDELNILVANENYGWPLVSGYCNAGTQTVCDSLGIKEPIEAWSPTIAPAGIEYFNSSVIPEWQNSVLIASLKEKRLFIATLDESEEDVANTSWILSDVFGRIRDVLIMDDRIYLCTSNRDSLGFPNDRDDIIIQLTPSKHTGLIKQQRPAFEAWLTGDKINFDQPMTGTARLFDAIGQCVYHVELKESIHMRVPQNLYGVFFLSLGAAYESKKFIRN